jgi:putative membrane protein
VSKSASLPGNNYYDPPHLSSSSRESVANSAVLPSMLLGGVVMMLTPSEAQAAATEYGSTLAAAGHYFGMIAAVAMLVFERFSIKPFMSEEEEDRIAIVNRFYSLSGLLLVYSGLLAATEYGKGWDVYINQPFFWLKMLFFAILTSSSVFNSTTLARRSLARALGRDVFVAPMGEQLVRRMVRFCNIQLATFIFIPLLAVGMAHGEKVDFNLSWEMEAVVVWSVFFGLTLKNLWDALNFEENNRGLSNYDEAPLVRSNSGLSNYYEAQHVRNNNNSARRTLSPGYVPQKLRSDGRKNSSTTKFGGLMTVSDDPCSVRPTRYDDSNTQRYSDLVQVFPTNPDDGVVDVVDFKKRKK